MDKRSAFSIGCSAAARAGKCSPRYVCPLCLRSFYDADFDLLTKEHVPSEALGGNILTLTCAACNSEAGSLLQGHQAEKVRQDKFWEGETEEPFNVEISTKYGTIRGEGTYDGIGSVKVDVHQHRMNPSEKEEMAKNSEGLEYESVRIGRGFSHGKARIADLRDAYLWVFARYGYRAIAFSAFDWIRDAIRQGETDQRKWSINIEGPSGQAEIPNAGSPIICWLDKPRDAFLICNGKSGIILPSPFNQDPYADLDDDKARIEIGSRCESVPEFMNMGFDFSDHQIFDTSEDD